MIKHKWLVALLIVSFWRTTAWANSLEPFWERKITRGIESYLIKPVQDLLYLNRHAKEYNGLVKRLQEIPAWLDKPGDLEEVRDKLSDYQEELIRAITILNKEKIPRLGIFNTTWTGVLVEEINQREVQNIFDLINRSLEEYRVQNQAGRPEKVCLACIEKLKHLLKAIPSFTPELKTTFSYARNREAIYQGNRLVAGLIEHFRDFNRVNIWWDSQGPAYSIHIAAQRKIIWSSSEQPGYHFLLGISQEGLEPAWKALNISQGFRNSPGGEFITEKTKPAHSAIKSVGYYSLKSLGDQESQKEISFALLSFEREKSAKEFWTRAGPAAKIQRHGDREEFENIILEKLSWSGQGIGYYAYGDRFGSYIILAQPRRDAWAENGSEEYQIIRYLAHKLIS